MYIPKEEQIRGNIKKAIKNAVLKSVEYIVLIFFILLSGSNDGTNSIIWSILLIFIGLMALWTIKNLLKKVNKLEDLNDSLNVKYDEGMKKLIKFIQKNNDVYNEYLLEYCILDYSYNADSFYHASRTFLNTFGYEEIHNGTWNIEWFMEHVEFLSKSEARAMVDEWMAQDLPSSKLFTIWMKRLNKPNICSLIFAMPSYDIDEGLTGFRVMLRDITSEVIKDDTIEGQEAFIKQTLLDNIRRNVIRERVKKQLDNLERRKTDDK